MTRPQPDEHAPYYAKYVALVPDEDITIAAQLADQHHETIDALRKAKAKGDFAYGPDKWTVKEVVGHMCDTERIFAYRALRFSRSDSTPVPGFDENTYAANGPYSNVSLSDLADEFDHVRRATIHLFANLGDEARSRRGTANAAEISVRALAYIIAGHETHHMGVIRDRYLNS